MARRADIKNATVRDFQDEIIQIDDFLGKGSDGLVYRAHYKAGPPFDLAVKFYAPTAQDTLFDETTKLPSFALDLQRRHDAELAHLRSLSHPHLQKYIAAGCLPYDKLYFDDRGVTLTPGPTVKLPFIVSKFVAAHTLATQLADGELSRTQLTVALLQVARALEYLHANDVIHGDVRAENILLEESASTNAVLIDFGISKRLHVGDNDRTRYFGPTNVPESIRALLKRYSDHDNFERASLRRILFPGVDLYFFALLLRRILASDASRSLSDFDREYATLVADELEKWRTVTSTAPDAPLTELYGCIRTTGALVATLDKMLAGPSYFVRKLDEKEREPPREIQRWNDTVEVRPSVAPFLSHPAIRRLHNLHQLSLIHYVYPSAGQTRFDHLLAALGAAQKVWRRLSARPQFLLHFDVMDIERLELLALLHDINHFPFLHYFQEAGLPSIRDAEILRTILDLPGGPPSPDAQTEPERAPTLRRLLQPYGIDEATLHAVLGDTTPGEWTPAMQVIKSIVNSGADVDKVAYVPDDAAYTGVPFGQGFDLPGLLAGMHIAEVNASYGRLWHIVFDKESLPAVESLCFARYWNFLRIYWHHTNRAIEAMIIYTIRAMNVANKDAFREFLLNTRDIGEAGALERLAETFKRQMYYDAPIAGLWSNRDVVYRRVWEMPLSGQGALLTRLQDETNGLETRQSANDRVEEIVCKFIEERTGGKTTPRRRTGQVILDVPLRTMDLGGAIFVREPDGIIRSIEQVSPVIRELALGFGRLSKTLRVYVAPALRDAVGKRPWEDEEFVKAITDAVLGREKPKEVG
jgi:HD superfamily phosphohydrolase/serine/threonine protein kinase